MSKKKFLFVVGCPRSGTTALGNLLSTHDYIFMGIERYVHRTFRNNFSLTPDLYELERFKRFDPGDTFYDTLDFAPVAYRDVDTSHANATYLGDKIPILFETLDLMFDAFGAEARVIFIFRNIFDVAASYKARAEDESDREWSGDKGVTSALRDWRAAINSYRTSAHQDRILPVIYERLFDRPDRLEPILRFLELPPSSSLDDMFKRMKARHDQLEAARKRDLSSEDVFKISLHAPFGGYRDIVAEAEAYDAK